MGQKKTSKKALQTKAVKTITKPDINSDRELVIWTFDKIDKNGKFAFDINRKDFKLETVFDKMLSYTKMSWLEIKKQTHDDGKSKHHILKNLNNISKEADERIKSMRFEQYSDQIFSFALENKLRIIGIRDGQIFHVIWYDPNHEFYPSNKTNT